MTHPVLENARKHPARDAAMRSITAVEECDREAWLANWHPEGVLEDPVGPSPMDPQGNGHHGIDAITAFYDNIIATMKVRFCIRQSFACGNECANVGTITTSGGDAVARTELMMVYRVDDHGKVLSLRAFWEFEDTVANTF
ncbi:MAG: nuclear transport factor 2 family protein [Halioglobus sp.]